MKKRVFAAVIAVVTGLCSVGCSTNATGTESVGNVIEDVVNTISGKSVPEGVYNIGDYIKPGTYLFTSEEESSYTQLIVFESKSNYDSYNNSGAFTIGEESEAIEKNALYSVFIQEGQSAYINLKSGYVLKVKGDELTKSDYSVSNNIANADGVDFCDGMIVGDDDLPEGQYKFTSVEAKYGAEVLIFESKDKYLSYHKMKRFTVGEESDAIDKYALDCQWISEGESCSAYLKAGTIVIISDGRVSIEKM